MATWENNFADFIAPGGRAPADHFKIVLYNLEPNEADLMLAGEFQRGNIRDRTFAGIDVDGTPFIPYSPRYAKEKGQTNVDLFGRKPSRHMLNALTVQIPEDLSSINIGIWDDGELATRAQVHNEGGSVRTRQGTGKRLYTRVGPRSFGGMGIRVQKKGGKAYFNMPRREFLGASEQDTQDMGALIVNSISARMENV